MVTYTICLDVQHLSEKVLVNKEASGLIDNLDKTISVVLHSARHMTAQASLLASQLTNQV